MLHYITYLQIYAPFFMAVIGLFLPGIVDYTIYVAGVFAVTCCIVLYYIKKSKKYSIPIFKLGIFMLIILMLYYMAPHIYGRKSDFHTSQLIAFSVQTIPFMLSAFIVAVKDEIQLKIKLLAPWVAVVFTAVSLHSIFFPTSISSTGLSNTENLNYQNLSYLSAFAAAFAGYFYVSYEKIRWTWPFYYLPMKMVMLSLVFVNLIGIFAAGGRGGVVMFPVLMLYLYYVMVKYGGKKISKKFIYLLLIIIVIVIFKAVQYVNSLGLDYAGFERIMAFLSREEAEGSGSRTELWVTYLPSILSSPIIGHGFGSVFFEMFSYAHNYFIDIMVETGLMGASVMLILIIRSYRGGMKLVSRDVSDSLWMIVLLQGLVEGFFSGYYLTNFILWWSVAFLYRKIQYQRFLRIKRIEKRDLELKHNIQLANETCSD